MFSYSVSYLFIFFIIFFETQFLNFSDEVQMFYYLWLLVLDLRIIS